MNEPTWVELWQELVVVLGWRRTKEAKTMVPSVDRPDPWNVRVRDTCEQRVVHGLSRVEIDGLHVRAYEHTEPEPAPAHEYEARIKELELTDEEHNDD